MMWITKPISAIVSAVVFLITLFLTAVGTAVLLGIDIPTISSLSSKEIAIVITITTFFMFSSACFYAFQRSLVIQDLKRRLDKKRDLQKRVDKLAQFRSRAINRIFAVTPKIENFELWRSEYTSWQRETTAFLQKNFPFAVVEMFSDLGSITPYNFQHASNDPEIHTQHVKILQMLSKELLILEKLISENTALTIEDEPSLLELIKWQETSQ